MVPCTVSILTMAETVLETADSTPFQGMFISALRLYEERTKKDLITHPLASRLQACDTSAAILTVLQEQAREFDQARVGDESLTKWLNPSGSVLYAFSAALSGGAGLVCVHRRLEAFRPMYILKVFSRASVIFAGIGVFLAVNIQFIHFGKSF